MKTPIFLILAITGFGCSSTEQSTGSSRDRGISAQPSEGTALGELTKPGTASLRFASTLAAAKEGASQDTFRLLGQRDIVIAMHLPAELLSDGAKLVHFELRNPEGVPQASKWYAVGIGENLPATILHPTFQREIPVQEARVQEAGVQSGVATMYGKIPIAGTNFTRSRLQGKFTATLRVGLNAAEPIAVHSFLMEL